MTEYITPSVAIQLVLIYLPFLVALVHILVWACRCGPCRQTRHSKSPKAISIPLSKLKDLVFSSVSEGDEPGGEPLPHRLIADVDYECLEDTDDITNETYSETNLDITY